MPTGTYTMKLQIISHHDFLKPFKIINDI